MKIEWAIPCRQITATDEGFVLAGVGKATGFLAPQFPTGVTVPVALCFQGEASDSDQERFEYLVRVYDPQGIVVAQAHGQVERNIGVGTQLVDPERYYRVIMLAWTAKETGRYTAEFRLIENATGRVVLPFYVSGLADPLGAGSDRPATDSA